MSSVFFIDKIDDKTVLVTTNKEEVPDEYLRHGYAMYPQRVRSFITHYFAWMYIEAYIQSGWTIEMDEEVWKIWESRPEPFDERRRS